METETNKGLIDQGPNEWDQTKGEQGLLKQDQQGGQSGS